MIKALVIAAAMVPLAAQASSLMHVQATCTQIETQVGKSKSTDYAATLVFDSSRLGELVVKVNGPDSAYKGANMIATVKNVELRRSTAGAQAMGTALETVRLRDRVTKYDTFTSVRFDKSSVRLVRMNEYDDVGVYPKRSSKRVVECTPSVALGSSEITELVAKVNDDL